MKQNLSLWKWKETVLLMAVVWQDLEDLVRIYARL
jgi:hypothetical protein